MGDFEHFLQVHLVVPVVEFGILAGNCIAEDYESVSCHGTSGALGAVVDVSESGNETSSVLLESALQRRFRVAELFE